MRLWHYKLIPYLPNSQLVAQRRELCSIFKDQPNHILINYVYTSDIKDLYNYTCKVVNELKDREINIKPNEFMKNYFGDIKFEELLEYFDYDFIPFKNYHTDRYLLQCFMNLQEKYDRGQKDFDEVKYLRLRNFVMESLQESNEDTCEYLYLNELH